MSASKQLYRSLHFTTSVTEDQVQNSIGKHSKNRIGNKKTTKKGLSQKEKRVLKEKKLKARQNNRKATVLARTYSKEDILQALPLKKRLEEEQKVEDEGRYPLDDDEPLSEDDENDELFICNCGICREPPAVKNNFDKCEELTQMIDDYSQRLGRMINDFIAKEVRIVNPIA